MFTIIEEAVSAERTHHHREHLTNLAERTQPAETHLIITVIDTYCRQAAPRERMMTAE
jgi:hypothetical protein